MKRKLATTALTCLTLTILLAAAPTALAGEDLSDSICNRLTAVTLWPPSHGLVSVGTMPVDGIEVRVFSDEANLEAGSGDYSPDAVLSKDLSGDTLVQLRAERSGGRSGRVYLITLAERDAQNEVKSFACCTIGVPKSQSPSSLAAVLVKMEAARTICADPEKAPKPPDGFHEVSTP